MANHWDRHYCGKCAPARASPRFRVVHAWCAHALSPSLFVHTGGLTYVYSKEEMKARGAAKPKAAAKVEVVAAAAPAGKGKKGKK